MLDKQEVSIPFVSGVDTKTDPIIAGKLSRADNCQAIGGTLQKRWGTVALSSVIDTGGNFAAGEALFAFDNELVRLNGGKAYGLSQSTPEWVTKPGGGHTATISAKQLVSNNRNQESMDHATVNGITGMAWWEAGVAAECGILSPMFGMPSFSLFTGAHFAAYDEATGTFYLSGATALQPNNGSLQLAPKVVAVGNNIHTYFLSGSSIYLANYNTATPETAPVVSTIATNAGIISAYDVTTADGLAILVYQDNSSPTNIIAVSITASGAVSSPRTVLSAEGVGVYAIAAAAADSVSSTSIYCVVDKPGFVGLSFFSFRATGLTSVLTLTTLDALAVGPTVSMVSHAPGKMTVFEFFGNGAHARYALLRNDASGIDTAPTAIPSTAYISAVSRAFMFDGAAVVTVVSAKRPTTNIQPTGYVIDTAGVVHARILPGLSAARSPRRGVQSCLSSVFSSNGSMAILVNQRNRLAYKGTANGALGAAGGALNATAIDITTTGITRINLAVAAANSLPINRLGNSVYIGGAQPRLYDGQQLVEAGFHTFPEGLVATAAATGPLSTGTYQYTAVYEWPTAAGERQQSAPAPPVTMTATSGQQGQIKVPQYQLNNRASNGLSVNIAIYRTTANGQIFYRLNTVDVPLTSSTTTAIIYFNDDNTTGVSDANIISQEILYTTGGVYSNIAPPAHKWACIHKQRLVAVGLEDPYEWRCSSQSVKGEPVRWNEAWGGRLPSGTGPLVSCASLDDKLILITTNAAYALYGDGPDLLGNNPFSAPQLITAVETGCVSAPSTVSLPVGVVFQTSKGLAMIGRDLSFNFWGADVEGYVQPGDMVRSAVLLPALQQVRIQVDHGVTCCPGEILPNLTTTSAGYCLVYDYFYRQWFRWPSYYGSGACLFNGVYTRVQSSGPVLQEQRNTWLDSGANYQMVAETSWLKAAGVQGFKRIWRALVAGIYGGDCTITIDAAYDYNESNNSQPATPVYASADTASIAGNGVFTPGNVFEIRRHMRVQKCAAMKLRFSDSALDSTGRGFALTDLTLELGVKKGAKKLPATQSL